MALSVRMFGLNSWSILVPQALMGVASVYLLYAFVARYFGNRPACSPARSWPPHPRPP
ncbi:MAG: glycosyltransferase family 39 protein [Candidatus Nanopelagicales bacterium]